MTEPPAKRINRTDEANIPENAQNNVLVSDQLTARLQNVGARIRKSVMEGYVMDRSASVPASPYASPTELKPSSETRIFQSAKDTLREVYSALPPGGYRAPQSSPSKRRHAQSEELDGDATAEDVDVAMQHSDSEAAEHSIPTYAGFTATHNKLRSVKPRRQFAQTQSLPAGFLRLSGDWKARQRLSDPVTKNVVVDEDEDWSEDPLTTKSTHDMEF